MSKLYEARKSNLINPLSKGEMEYTFKCEYVNDIIKNLNEKRYGSYLIGGIVGTGKSSLVDIATSYSKEKALTVHINFYNENEIGDNFSKIVLEHLIDELENENVISDEKLSELVAQSKLELHYSMNEQLDKKETIGSGTKRIKKEDVSLFSKLGFGFKGGISSEASIEGKGSLEDEKYNDENQEMQRTISMTKMEHDRIEDIVNIVRQLDGLNVIFIFDELDKMNTDILERIFKKYKSLFMESNIFSFFLVDDEMYLKYSDSNICKNKLYTYFSGKYYLPLLTFEETLRYCVMMFGESKYLMGLCKYYNSLGNYRLINISYNQDDGIDAMILIKAYIFKCVINKINAPYLEHYQMDAILKKIKIVIEELIKVRNFTIEDFEYHLEKCNVIDTVWPKKREMINWVIGAIRDIIPSAIEMEERYVSINAATLYEQFMLFESAALKDREILTEDAYDIQISDMYHQLKKGSKVYKKITFLHENIIPLQVANNDPKAYKEALVNIVRANLYQKEMQVIVLQRERKEESVYNNDHVYTGIVVVEKGGVQVAYYVDEGSYDSEKFEAIEELVKASKEYGVDVKEMTIEEHINLEERMGDIVERYNRE